MTAFNRWTWMTLVTMGIGAVSGEAAERISVRSFGLEPGTKCNALPGVMKALDACRTKPGAILVFPKGRYDFWPVSSNDRDFYQSNTSYRGPMRCGILVESMTNLVIDGQGSAFIYHDRIAPFVVSGSEGIVIQNVSIDWDIPLTAQAEGRAVNGRTVDLHIDPVAYPFEVKDNRLVFFGEGWTSAWWGTMAFDPKTRLIPPQSGDAGLGQGRIEKTGKDSVRLHDCGGRIPDVGTMLVLRHSERDHAGIFFQYSRNVACRNVNLYHCAGLGLLAQYCENVTLDHYNAAPNKARGRFLSGHDDGAQISNCRGLVRIEHCEFEGLMDDPINIHGTCVKILKRVGQDRLRARFMHGQSIGMRFAVKGDEVSFINHTTMLSVATNTVVSFTPHDACEFDIAFAQPVPDSVKEGDAIENMTWTPDAEIRHCRFGSCRARGLLLSTPGRVVIESNVFESSGAAILIAGDANRWFESGAVHDVVIRHNQFKYPCLSSLYQFCNGVISICPEIPSPDPARPFHRNIRIEGNVFDMFDRPLLFAFSVDGLVFKGNTVTRNKTFTPFHGRKDLLTFRACRKVVVEENDVAADVLSHSIGFEQTDKKEVVVGTGQGIDGGR